MVVGSIPPPGNTAAAADRSERAGGLHLCNLHNLEKNTKILQIRASSQNRTPLYKCLIFFSKPGKNTKIFKDAGIV